MNTLNQELAAGFHSSKREAFCSGVGQPDLAYYIDQLDGDYSYLATRRAIVTDSLDQEPQFTTASFIDDNPEKDEAVALELITKNDKKVFIDAENDARRAAIETDTSINEIDRILGIVGVSQSVSGNEKGE